MMSDNNIFILYIKIRITSRLERTNTAIRSDRETKFIKKKTCGSLSFFDLFSIKRHVQENTQQQRTSYVRKSRARKTRHTVCAHERRRINRLSPSLCSVFVGHATALRRYGRSYRTQVVVRFTHQQRVSAAASAPPASLPGEGYQYTRTILVGTYLARYYRFPTRVQ